MSNYEITIDHLVSLSIIVGRKPIAAVGNIKPGKNCNLIAIR